MSWVKHAGVIFYLLLISVAGVTALAGKFYFWPWDNWGMFSLYPPYHRELVAYGVRNNSETTRLSMEEYFPMPAALIERGRGVGIDSSIARHSSENAAIMAYELCSHVLKTELFKDVKRFDAMKIGWEFSDLNSGSFLEKRILAECFQ